MHRSKEVGERTRMCHLVDEVIQNGGFVHIFPTNTEAEQRLEKVGSLAAIMLYPIFEC